MASASVDQLRRCASDLAVAADTLARLCTRSSDSDSASDSDPTSQHARDDLDAPGDLLLAKMTTLTRAVDIQTLLSGPEQFLQQLAQQTQILACVQWLGDFQVLACIPLDRSVSFRDVADLAHVPEAQLTRVIRMVATAGFLRESHTGHVCHSPLSTPFATQPSMLDAAMFLTETVAPAALHFSLATKRYGHSQTPSECGYNLAFNTRSTFASLCELRPKLQRQWPAFQEHGIGDLEAGLVEVLLRVDWQSLGNATVVLVGAASNAAAMVIASTYPALRFVIQSPHALPNRNTSKTSQMSTASRELYTPRSPTSSPVECPAEASLVAQFRYPGTIQCEENAAMYILYLSPSSQYSPGHSMAIMASAELRAHLGILRSKASARLILVANVLPSPGSVHTDVEARARLRDLSLLQLSNERHLEVSEIQDWIHGVHDNMGGLIISDELRSPCSSFVAFVIKFQSFATLQGMGPLPAG